jgi:hypothetical protein
MATMCSELLPNNNHGHYADWPNASYHQLLQNVSTTPGTGGGPCNLHICYSSLQLQHHSNVDHRVELKYPVWMWQWKFIDIALFFFISYFYWLTACLPSIFYRFLLQ